MIIGIDASRAFIKKRTGIEEYSFQVIKHLAYRQVGLIDKLDEHQVVLYVKKAQKSKIKNQNYNLKLKSDEIKIPDNWKVRVINFSRFWTQIGLSLEILFHPVDVLFVPAHIIPWITPKETVVTIHGLEYEFCPKAYSFWERCYMRFFIRRSCRKSSQIVAVSENTKKDLMRLYEVPEKKIEVIYEGYEISHSREGGNPVSRSNIISLDSRLRGNDRYVLFVGRLEERKNIGGIIQAFEILKEKYALPHKLVLAGRPGYGYKNAKVKMQKSKFKKDILELGFVNVEKKWELYENADVFLFPSFYEGFGLPILEAQRVRTPVLTSDVSSLPEVAGEGALLADPKNPEDIAEKTEKLISDQEFRSGIIKKGLENVKRFSWEKCAQEILRVLIEK